MYRNLIKIGVLILVFFLGFFIAKSFFVDKNTNVAEEKEYAKELALYKHLGLQLSLPIKSDKLVNITSNNLFRLYVDEGYWYSYPSLEDFIYEVLIGQIDISLKASTKLEDYDIQVLSKNDSLVESYTELGVNYLFETRFKKIGRNEYFLDATRVNSDELATIIFIMNRNNFFVIPNDRKLNLFFTKSLAARSLSTRN